ncbi:hypothetical protein CEXT_794331 [Caerostris extrusa]|uniref:Uncharacterized protein n=1 Tax=Caerostris extrusa TaxID=172846 RepID=A0AAV4Y1W6_CAEEX|nr:hypothetical protein CEXT_794331 [Caerostris extrusa]
MEEIFLKDGSDGINMLTDRPEMECRKIHPQNQRIPDREFGERNGNLYGSRVPNIYIKKRKTEERRKTQLRFKRRRNVPAGLRERWTRSLKVGSDGVNMPTEGPRWSAAKSSTEPNNSSTFQSQE